MTTSTQDLYTILTDLWTKLTEEEQQITISSIDINSTSNLTDYISDKSRNILVKHTLIDEQGELSDNATSFIRALAFMQRHQLETLAGKDLIEALKAKIEPYIDFEQIKEQPYFLRFIVAHLINRHNKKELIRLSFQPNDSVAFQMRRNLCESVQHLDLDTSEIIELAQNLLASEFDKSSIRHFFSAHLIQSRPKIAEEVAERLQQQRTSDVSKNLLDILLAYLAIKRPSNAPAIIQQSEQWLSGQNPDDQLLGLRILHILVENKKYLPNDLLNLLKNAIRTLNSTTTFEVVQTIALLRRNHQHLANDCEQLLINCFDSSSAEELYKGVSSAIWYPNSGYDCSLLKFLTSAPYNKQIIDNIRMCLRAFSPDMFWQYLERWIGDHDMQTNHLHQISSEHVFRWVMRDIHQKDSQKTITVVTKWLASGDAKLAIEAIGIIGVYAADIGELDANEIRQWGVTQTQYVVEKLLLTHPEYQSAYDLIVSVIRHSPHASSLDLYFKDALYELTYEYPGAFQAWHEGLERTDYDKNTWSVIKSCHDKSSMYYAAREKLPMIYELVLSNKRFQLFEDARSKVMAWEMERAEAQSASPIHQIVPRSALSRGNRFFHMQWGHPDPDMRRAFSPPQPLGTFEESIELPQSTVIDPEQAEWRYRRRIALSMREEGQT